ncbi:LytR/AlgR family response regulator transcription factor [Ideonella sp.]|uniref:LytR/AlgR family response regulator transcription factor n=1 Tax=Ideonella sp. TaxID=1929293 RepID=UPI003BB7DC01
MNPTALIAEDEPLLAQALRAELARAWLELQLSAMAADGEEAVELALAQLPDLLFLDIRMPGRTGLEAAQAIVEEWPEGRALPLIVFVTAYDQYALQAFEACAVDYLLKPVQASRLAAACQRLRGLLAGRPSSTSTPAAMGEAATAPADLILSQLRALLGSPLHGAQTSALPAGSTDLGATAPLRLIQAANGNSVHMIPVGEVVYFEAADKYIRVLTADREYLIRTALRELVAQLDDTQFWQIHRGTLVRADEIREARRDESGKVQLLLRSRPERLAVSRLYAARFKGM